jgi:hypothetical protein
MTGVDSEKKSVDMVGFPPTLIWKSRFPDGLCNCEHTLALWATSPITETVLPNGIVELTDAAGHKMSIMHEPSSHPTWKMCDIRFHRGLSGSFELNFPVALTAPYQVSFPGCELPGVAAAERREWSRMVHEQDCLKRKATEGEMHTNE